MWIGLNVRALGQSIIRIVTGTGGMFYVPPPDSPAWGPVAAEQAAPAEAAQAAGAGVSGDAGGSAT